MSSKKRRTYSEDFKKQMVALYESGKSPSEIIEEYDLSPASIYQWRKQFGSNSSNDVTVDNKGYSSSRTLDLFVMYSTYCLILFKWSKWFILM